MNVYDIGGKMDPWIISLFKQTLYLFLNAHLFVCLYILALTHSKGLNMCFLFLLTHGLPMLSKQKFFTQLPPFVWLRNIGMRRLHHPFRIHIPLRMSLLVDIYSVIEVSCEGFMGHVAIIYKFCILWHWLFW